MRAIRIFGTPVKITVTVLANLLVLVGVVVWWEMNWHPERELWLGILVGAVTMILLFTANMGHAVAHIFSASCAKAPMDEILIAAGMPRTLYLNNTVTPIMHKVRARGGPIFSLFGLLVSMMIYQFTSGYSIARELAAWLRLIVQLDAAAYGGWGDALQVVAGRKGNIRDGGGCGHAANCPVVWNRRGNSKLGIGPGTYVDYWRGHARNSVVSYRGCVR